MKILIVDDEKKTSAIIAKQISLNSNGEYETQQAGDGLEALEIILRDQPDILLCDINMPHMNGLELIRIIREKNYAMEIIVMSGYNDFEYARNAIRYNVIDYLLKPISPAELFRQIHKAEERIKEKKQISSSLRIPFFTQLLNGMVSSKDAMREMETMDLPNDSSHYCVAMIGSADVPKKPEIVLINRLMENFQNQSVRIYNIDKDANCTIWIFFFKDASEKDVENRITSIIDDINTALGDRTRAWAASSLPVSSTNGLKNAFDQAKAVFSGTMVRTPGVSFYRTKEDSGMKEALMEAERTVSDILALMASCNEKALSDFSDLEEMLSPYAVHNTTQVREVLLLLARRIESFIEGNLDAADADNIRPLILDIKTMTGLGEITKTLQKLIDQTICIYRSSNTPASTMICDTIKAKIRANLSNPSFSVQDAIADLSYSENYIRYIFSNTEGTTIKEYITRERMDKACSLLMENMQIKKIAELTGYDNQRYFAKCFKDHTGYTPTEWRVKNEAR